MILTKAHIQKYKCIEDSQEWKIDQITCLVGKNEAGKSALLEALYKVNPVDSNANKFAATDYPRRTALTDDGKKDAKHAIVVTTYWTLEEVDLELLRSEFSEANVTSDTLIKLSKGYDGNLHWDIPIDESEIVLNLINSKKFNAVEKASIGKPNTIDELRSSLNNAKKITTKQQELLNRLNSAYIKDDDTDIGSCVGSCLEERLPHFVYFGEYERLPGKVSINDLITREYDGTLTFGLKIFQALLQLANSSAREFSEAKESEELIMRLEAVSNRLSDEIFEYWSQNKHLRVEFRCDMARDNDPKPFNSGWVFQTRIRNERHRATVNFDERSTGFIWFFSFLVWFSQMRENYGDNLIILLDEPGLTLHGRAQQDLLRYIRERLSQRYQVIYTTHSPFMLNSENIFSLRTVEDVVEYKGSEEKCYGTRVKENIFGIDRDTILPLQGYIGYDIANTLFLGPYMIVVEGPSEHAYLKWFDRALAEVKREGLDIRWAIVPAEGAAKVSSFVSLFRGRISKIAVLMDYHCSQKRMVDRLEQSGLLEEHHLLRTTDFLGKQGEADIEDLIGWGLYTWLVNNALNLPENDKLSVKQRPEGDVRIAKQIREHVDLISAPIAEYNHLAIARHLGRFTYKQLSEVDGLEFALDNFEKLFGHLNQLIGHE